MLKSYYSNNWHGQCCALLIFLLSSTVTPRLYQHAHIPLPHPKLFLFTAYSSCVDPSSLHAAPPLLLCLPLSIKIKRSFSHICCVCCWSELFSIGFSAQEPLYFSLSAGGDGVGFPLSLWVLVATGKCKVYYSGDGKKARFESTNKTREETQSRMRQRKTSHFILWVILAHLITNFSILSITSVICGCPNINSISLIRN